VDQFSEVTLTSEETAEALRLARQTKYQQIKKQEWFDKISREDVWYHPTAKDYFDSLRQTRSQSGKAFQVVAWNEPVIKSLCLYFAKDHRSTLDPSKGIMLTGNTGTGKTHLMNFFAKNQLASYLLPTCKHISEKYATGWEANEKNAIEHYSINARADMGHPFGQKELGYCFGDLGAEEDANSYGNKRNVMESIIHNRYETQIPFIYTHFTCNLNMAELEKRYGPRFTDRIKEMCNVVVLQGESWRR
jgi:hypothetical protein